MTPEEMFKIFKTTFPNADEFSWMAGYQAGQQQQETVRQSIHEYEAKQENDPSLS